jgi:hypothetical protein
MKEKLTIWWEVWRDDLTMLGKLTLWPLILPFLLLSLLECLFFRDNTK